MSIYSLIYIILAIVLGLNVVRQRIDLLSVAAVCYVVYSIYCIPGIGLSGAYAPVLSRKLYLLVYIQMLIILVFLYFSRRREQKLIRIRKENMSIDKAKDQSKRILLKRSFLIYTGVICLFALINVVRIGFSGFSAGKEMVWEQADIFYIISLYGAYPAFAYGIHTRTKSIWIPSLLVELTIFFSGSRAFATTLAIMFLCDFGYEMWKKYKNNYKLYLLGAAAVLFLLMYRMVDVQIMQGDFAGALDILKRPETWLEALEFNEPRVIIANYDYVITRGFRLPIGDTIYRLLDFVPGLTALIPITLLYPEYFSAWLKDSVHAVRGVGGSIWGESYAMFGVAGIILFTLLWLIFLYKCNEHLDYHNSWSYFLVALGSYFAWYINRLEFNLLGQACKVMLLCFLIWVVIYLMSGGELVIRKLRFRMYKKTS